MRGGSAENLTEPCLIYDCPEESNFAHCFEHRTSIAVHCGTLVSKYLLISGTWVIFTRDNPYNGRTTREFVCPYRWDPSQMDLSDQLRSHIYAALLWEPTLNYVPAWVILSTRAFATGTAAATSGAPTTPVDTAPIVAALLISRRRGGSHLSLRAI
jgi:hypothetical protein